MDAILQYCCWDEDDSGEINLRSAVWAVPREHTVKVKIFQMSKGERDPRWDGMDSPGGEDKTKNGKKQEENPNPNPNPNPKNGHRPTTLVLRVYFRLR